MSLIRFIRSDSGAVTVDWVVLTAALVGLGIAVLGVVSSGFSTQSTRIQTELARNDIICENFCDRFAAAEE